LKKLLDYFLVFEFLIQIDFKGSIVGGKASFFLYVSEYLVEIEQREIAKFYRLYLTTRFVHFSVDPLEITSNNRVASKDELGRIDRTLITGRQICPGAINL